MDRAIRNWTKDMKCARAALRHFDAACAGAGRKNPLALEEHARLLEAGAVAAYGRIKAAAGEAGLDYPMDGYRSVGPGTDAYALLEACCLDSGITVAGLLNALAVRP